MIVLLICMMAIFEGMHADDVVHGYAHSCAIRHDSVKCWGFNGYGQLGLGDTTNRHQPEQEGINLGTSFVPKQLSCGAFHCCALSLEDSLKCWGYNGNGQLGYEDTNHHGDAPNEMGDDLSLVTLPSGFLPKMVSAAYHSTCAVSYGNSTVCWGRNEYGQLGLGHTNSIGDQTDEMGDHMVITDLGDTLGPIAQIEGMLYGFCAVSTEGKVKCWGRNQFGQLGLGDQNNRGDAGGEMSDDLPFTNLGTQFVVDDLDCGQYHCCAMSLDGVLKCWGRNEYGQLGYGDDNHRGDGSNEMGENLLAVSLGSDFVVREFECGLYSTCAISTVGVLKCWGRNDYGQLGLGDTNYRGDNSNEMGDYLSAVDYGSGFNASGIHIAGSLNYRFRCIFEDSSTGLLAKCFGYNHVGQLGYGDTTQRGNTAASMGNNLPFVSFGEWPTSSPTATPSAAPTTPPTASPSMSPSAAPTDECSADGLYHANWNDLMTGSGGVSASDLLLNHSVSFEASTLLLRFEATLKYVGESADGVMDHINNLGTTYWIDLQSFSEFDSMDNGIANAGSCGNRRAADYGPLTFGEFWKYTVDPADLANASNADRMAYPPSDWTLSASGCNAVNYERTFPLANLAACTDADGAGLVTAEQSDTMVSFSGSFFVEMVSPYSATTSYFYRTLSLLEYPFNVQLARSAKLLASTGVQLSLMTVHSITNDEDGNYRMLVLSQTADYMELDGGALMTAPDAVTVSGVSIEQKTTGCLLSTSFVCGQLFAVTIPKPADLNCSDSSSSTVDLSGTFGIAFTPSCRLIGGSEDVRCSTLMAELPQSNTLLLEAPLQFQDATCGPNLFSADIGASMAFYAEDTFSTPATTFTIARDTVYCEVEMSSTTSVQDASGTAIFDLISLSVENVYVCTSASDLSASLSSTEGDGGCLSSAVDADGYYTVIGSGADSQFGGRTDYAAPSNVARFSFTAFDTGRTAINVHVEVLVTLQNESGGRRRRMLLQNVASNQIRHLIGSPGLVQPEEVEVEEGDATMMNVEVVAAIGGAVVIGVMVFVVLIWKRGSWRKEEAGMAVHVSAQSPSSVTLEANTAMNENEMI